MKRYAGYRLARACTIGAALLLLPLEADAGKKDRSGGGEYDLVVLAPPTVEVIGGYLGDLNAAGDAVGTCVDANLDEYGYYYHRASGEYLVFGPGIALQGLSNAEEIVGNDLINGEGLYWRSPLDPEPVALPPLPVHTKTSAKGINGAGIIIGTSQGNGFDVAVAWQVNQAGVVSAPIELPFPQGYSGGSVKDLSEHAEGVTDVVGIARDPAGTSPDKAVRWTLATDEQGLFVLAGPTDLGSLIGTDSSAAGVNSQGDVVGRSDEWPVVVQSGAAVQPLPGLRKATVGSATGINDQGQMVGEQGYARKDSGSHEILVFAAVLWNDANSVVDLNTKVNLGPGETLESAYRINNSGVILGTGFFPSVSNAGNLGYLIIPKGS